MRKAAQAEVSKYIRDPDIARMAEIAADLGAENAAGGWVQCVNYDAPEQSALPFTKNTWTTVADIVAPQRPSAFPANVLHDGSIIRVMAFGTITSVAGTATFTPSFYWNGAASGTVLCAGAAQTPATTTVFGWFAELQANVSAIGGAPAGATTTLAAHAHLMGWNATQTTMILLPSTGVPQFTIATNAAGYISMAAACSTSNAANQIITYGYSVEALN